MIQIRHILFLFFAALFLVNASFSATLYVNGTAGLCNGGVGSNFTSIGSAITAASAGDTIIVCSNSSVSYFGAFTIDKSINLFGNESGVPISGSGVSEIALISNANYVNISNLSFVGIMPVGATNAITISGSNFTRITNSNFTNSPGINSGTAVNGMSSAFHDLVFENNTINGVRGVYLNNTHNISIYNNVFTGNATTEYMSDPAHNAVYMLQVQDANITQNNISYYYIAVNVNRSSAQATPVRVLNNLNIINNVYGLFLLSAEYVNISGNVISNSTNGSTGYGAYLSTSGNQFIGSNIITGSSQAGLYLDSTSSSNVIHSNNISRNIWGAYLLGSSTNNLSSNIINNNSQAGVFLAASFADNQIFGNTIYNHSAGLASGIYLNYTNSANRIYNNFVLYSNTYGVYLNYSNNTNISNNNISTISTTDGTGVYLYSSNLNNMTNNNISVTAFTNAAGFNINSGSSNNTVSGGFISGPSILGTWGVLVQSSGSYNSISFATITRFSSCVILNGPNLTNISSNTISNCTNGILLQLSYNSIIRSNNLSNGSLSGIITSSSINTVNSFSDNIITNSTAGVNVSANNLTFTGNNYVYSTPSGGYDIYLDSRANLSTSTYNLTTNYLSFGLNTTKDVSIKSVNMSTVSNQGISAIDSLNIGGATALSTPSLFSGLNVTNTSSSPLFSPIFYYNTTQSSGYSAVMLGRFNASSIWFAISPFSSSSGILTYLNYSGPFSYFLPIAYSNATPSPASSESSSSPAKKSELNIIYSFDPVSYKLIVTVSSGGFAVSGINVNLFYTADYSYVKAVTDANGKVVFTIGKSGSYQIDILSNLQYNAISTDIFLLQLAPQIVVVQPPVANEGGPVVNPEPVPVPPPVGPNVNPQPDNNQPNDKKDALDAIANADLEIIKAIKEGKDVTEAKKALDIANSEISAGNYENAKKLALQATSLANSAKVKVVLPPTSTNGPEKQKTGFGLGDFIYLALDAIKKNLVLILLLLFVVLGIYYYTRRGDGKAGKKNYKGYENK